jgi:hypothetical protein
MALETKCLSPFRFAAGASVVMAGFWFHDAHITLCQTHKTRVTVTLIKTFAGFFLAMDAKNLSGILQIQVLTETGIYIQRCFTDGQVILHRISESCDHFFYAALHVFSLGLISTTVIITAFTFMQGAP